MLAVDQPADGGAGHADLGGEAGLAADAELGDMHEQDSHPVLDGGKGLGLGVPVAGLMSLRLLFLRLPFLDWRTFWACCLRVVITCRPN